MYGTHFQLKFIAEGQLFLKKRNQTTQSDKWRKIPQDEVLKATLSWKNSCKQFAMKVEATSIAYSISLNMSMAL